MNQALNALLDLAAAKLSEKREDEKKAILAAENLQREKSDNRMLAAFECAQALTPVAIHDYLEITNLADYEAWASGFKASIPECYPILFSVYPSATRFIDKLYGDFQVEGTPFIQEGDSGGQSVNENLEERLRTGDIMEAIGVARERFLLRSELENQVDQHNKTLPIRPKTPINIDLKTQPPTPTIEEALLALLTDLIDERIRIRT